MCLMITKIQENAMGIVKCIPLNSSACLLCVAMAQ